jgi:hypothetical protein
MHSTRPKGLGFVCAALWGCSIAGAAVHIETGEAGISLLGPQVTSVGSSSLDKIVGTLSFDFDADIDLYQIYIDNPLTFSAKVSDTTIPDTQLFLFDVLGNGVAANDDTATGNTRSTIPTGWVTASGVYYLAITGFDTDPVDAADAFIFREDNPRTVYGPEAGRGPLAGWDLDADSQPGDYEILLTGALGSAPATIPLPSALAGGVLLGGVLAGRRRR